MSCGKDEEPVVFASSVPFQNPRLSTLQEVESSSGDAVSSARFSSKDSTFRALPSLREEGIDEIYYPRDIFPMRAKNGSLFCPGVSSHHAGLTSPALC